MLLARPPKTKSFDARPRCKFLNVLAACGSRIGLVRRIAEGSVLVDGDPGDRHRIVGQIPRRCAARTTIASTTSIPFVTWPKSV